MRDASVLLQCNHRFHASCLLGQHRCPLCRKDAGFPTRDALNNAVYAESAGLREEVQKLTAEASSPVDTIDESVLHTLSLASVATSRGMRSLQQMASVTAGLLRMKEMDCVPPGRDSSSLLDAMDRMNADAGWMLEQLRVFDQ
jgi:hypothetical protein